MKTQEDKQRGSALKAYLETRLPLPGVGSISALARKAGLRPSTLTAWWGRGAVPDNASLERLATVMGVDLAEVVAAYRGSGASGRSWVFTDAELEALLKRAAKEAVREVLAEREGR
jgi:transcriptional regulator with XRE-family HTH domain